MNRNLIPIAWLSLFAAGCVPSLYPIYKEGDIFTDSRIEGRWKVEDEEELWEFEADPEGGKYQLSLHAEGTIMHFEARLVRLSPDREFLDLFPVKPDAPENFFAMHFVRVHSFYRLRLKDSSLELAVLEGGWFENQSGPVGESSPGGSKVISYLDTPEGIRLLTSPTDVLQKVLLEHFDDPGLFADPIQMRRTGE